MRPYARHLLIRCQTARSSAAAAGVHVKTILLDRDFIEWASPGDLFQRRPGGLFDLVIMNPPYRKLNRATRELSLVEQPPWMR